VGSGTADKLKEIEELRASLGAKLEEIERRLPFAGFGKKAAAAVAGTSLATPLFAFLFRRARGKTKSDKKKRKKNKTVSAAVAPQSTSVTINVLPKGAAYLAAAGLAGWAGLKVYEAVQRKRNGSAESFKPAVVTQMPEAGRHAGS